VTHRPENARKKKYARGLDNSGNIEGICFHGKSPFEGKTFAAISFRI
jgi:hypothetical protein